MNFLTKADNNTAAYSCINDEFNLKKFISTIKLFVSEIQSLRSKIIYEHNSINKIL
jgi:hypothetical protein